MYRNRKEDSNITIIISIDSNVPVIMIVTNTGVL